MKKFLSLLLIPYLLVFINSKYVLVIDNTSFEFTLEENDVAKEFKEKFPLNITMNVFSDYLEYKSDSFWTTSFSCSWISTQSGYIDAKKDNYGQGIYIRLSSVYQSDKNIGKIKEPELLKKFVKGKGNVMALFIGEKEEEEEEKEEEEEEKKEEKEEEKGKEEEKEGKKKEKGKKATK